MGAQRDLHLHARRVPRGDPRARVGGRRRLYARRLPRQEHPRQTGFDLDIVVHRGAGAYICGEETGLIESLEGKKGQPRKKPPFPAQHGVFGLPTIVNNVETFAHVPHIVAARRRVVQELRHREEPGHDALRCQRPRRAAGAVRAAARHAAARDIFEHAGGVRGGRTLKGVIPGGLSMPILPPTELDVPMAEGVPVAEGHACSAPAAIMVMDETRLHGARGDW